MNHLYKCFIAVLLWQAAGTSFAQAPAIEWQNTIGGNNADKLRSLIQTSDGGYLLGGYSASGISGDKTEASLIYFDYWIVKLDAFGSIEWQNTIGGSNEDVLNSVIQTTDGGYLLGGYSESGISGDKTEAWLGGADYWVVKLDDTGNIEWQNTIGGSNTDIIYSVIQTLDGGYLLGGYSSSGISVDKTEANLGGADYWVVKLDATGNIEWQNTIGGSSFDYLYSVIQTSDGGYLLGGGSASGISGDKTEASLGISYDYWVVKLDASGNIELQNTIGGSALDYLHSVIQTSDSGYLLGGYSASGISGDKTEASLGATDYWVVKLDATGNIEWQNTIGGSSDDYLYSVIQNSDGDYLLAGYSYSGVSGDKTEANLGDADYWVIKLLGESNCNVPSGLSVSDLTATSATLHWDDAGADATGYKLQMINITDNSSNTININEGITSKNIGSAVLTPGKDYAFRLRATCGDGSKTAWSEPYFFSTPLRLAGETGVVAIYPNPNNGEFALQLPAGTNGEFIATITDMMGRVVDVRTLPAQTTITVVPLSLMAVGMYQVLVQSSDAMWVERVIVQE